MMNTDLLKRSIGAIISENGNAFFRTWAPGASSLHLLFENGEKTAMQKDGEYWILSQPNCPEGSRYKFMIDNKDTFPDPASLSQPKGVHDFSELLDIHSFKWDDSEWKNPSLGDYIIYELHTGTFTAEGNFRGIESKLDHLIELGINAIEIMPVAQFPGNRNWGYDGVYPFAVQHSYGGAKGLQKLVNACHKKGIAVILDVVYNHLGPEGNYFQSYGPYFTDKYKTPWGSALNFDDAYCDGVRNYFIENAMMWFRDFHIDALRLDAVHAIKDLSAEHILESIKKCKDQLEKKTGRSFHLITEVDLNDPRFINPIEKGGLGMDAQWIDEFHHALRITAGGEKTGYYEDFNGIEHLAKSYCDAYVYDGQYSPHRKKSFGKKTYNSGDQFIVFSQNHDQVGNRMLGERCSWLFSFEMQKLMAGAVMVSPFIPMLFMGEEWSETHPFLYFVSHTDMELAEAVRKGRKEEFRAFHSIGEAPDPLSEESYNNSKLQWQLLQEEKHEVMFSFYKALIATRKKYSSLHTHERKNLHVECYKEKNTILLHRWFKEQHLVCMMNFSNKKQYIMPPVYTDQWHKVFDSAHPQWLGQSKAPQTVNAGKPGISTIELAEESFLLYCNQSNIN